MFLLEICNKTNKKINEEWLKAIFQDIMKEIGLAHKEKRYFYRSFGVSLCFISDSEIKKINKKYRGIDKATDVLSFALSADNKFISPSGSDVLGEIFISYNQAKKQSEIYNCSIEEELAFLFIHGILHLMGYDHETDKDEKIMKEFENNILKKINV
jgi:probable rRNA maturation factor